ncbi:MAG TPA: tryptophan 2,3-dioxygenase family protein, partial [Arthrobacter sp.]|nr:tryptophan 2,3-dioxygenase family protein [Arthrobacter sp.]
MTVDKNTRRLEDNIETDFSDKMSYGSYLSLDQLLSAQHPVSRPEHHDELLFIIQHQTSELWLKLVLHELRTVRQKLRDDDLRFAMKGMARIKHIQRSLTEQWSVLATLTPSEYAEFRGALGSSSGFQSYQYRAVEFLLGNKNKGMLGVFANDPAAQALLAEHVLRLRVVVEDVDHVLVLVAEDELDRPVLPGLEARGRRQEAA